MAAAASPTRCRSTTTSAPARLSTPMTCRRSRSAWTTSRYLRGRGRGAQFGAARDFEANVTYRETPTATPEKRTIRVNQPLDVDGARGVPGRQRLRAGRSPSRDGNGRQSPADGPVAVPAPTMSNYTSTGCEGARRHAAAIGLLALFLPTGLRPRRPARRVSIFPDAPITPGAELRRLERGPRGGLRGPAVGLPARRQQA